MYMYIVSLGKNSYNIYFSSHKSVFFDLFDVCTSARFKPSILTCTKLYWIFSFDSNMQVVYMYMYMYMYIYSVGTGLWEPFTYNLIVSSFFPSLLSLQSLILSLPPSLFSLSHMSHLSFTDNNTLLHFAARNSLPQLFSLLLSFPGGGTALTLRNNDGNTPFDLARQSSRTSVKAILEW